VALDDIGEEMDSTAAMYLNNSRTCRYQGGDDIQGKGLTAECQFRWTASFVASCCEVPAQER